MSPLPRRSTASTPPPRNANGAAASPRPAQLASAHLAHDARTRLVYAIATKGSATIADLDLKTRRRNDSKPPPLFFFPSRSLTDLMPQLFLLSFNPPI